MVFLGFSISISFFFFFFVLFIFGLTKKGLSLGLFFSSLLNKQIQGLDLDL